MPHRVIGCSAGHMIHLFSKPYTSPQTSAHSSRDGRKRAIQFPSQSGFGPLPAVAARVLQADGN